jgi:hypothetical protein
LGGSQIASVLANGTALRRHIGETQPRFPPGFVVNYGLLERILLVEVLSNAIGESPYRYIETMFDGLDFGTFADTSKLSHLGVNDLRASMRGITMALNSLHDRAPGWHVAIQDDRSFAPAVPSRIAPPDIAPARLGWGVGWFGTGAWGQNGFSSEGYFGFRVLNEQSLVVCGRFLTRFERDVILADICASRSDRRAQLNHSSIGDLNGLHISEIIGTYEGPPGASLTITRDDQILKLSFYRDGIREGAALLKIDEDGGIRSRFRALTMFEVNFFRHPADRRTCVQIGLRPYIRTAV